MNKGRKPDIVCIGSQKSGTSWLHVLMSGRPDIWVPPFKELHFFDHKFIEECRRWAPWHVKRGLKQARESYISAVSSPDEDYLVYLDNLKEPPILNGTWYKYVFSQAQRHQKCLDVTPEYSCIPDVGVNFFKRFLPEARLIYLIRHPFDRMMSQLRMNAHRRKEPPKTKQDWADLLEMPALTTRGDYLNNVPRWDRSFASDQLLYLPFGRIAGDAINLLRDIELHCGLPPYEYRKASHKIHQTEPLLIPKEVQEQLSERASPQDEFLRKRFGEEFLRLSK